MLDLVSFIPRAVAQGIPLLFGSTGEIVTEKSGNLNLGIPGVMYVGGICGVIGSFLYERSLPDPSMANPVLGVAIPVGCCLLGSLLMGLLYCFLTVTLRANQNVTGLAMTTFGVGFGNFFGGSLIKLTGATVPSIALSTTSRLFRTTLPFASSTGWFGKMILSFGFLAYVAIAIALIASYVMNRTKVGLQLRAVGENPATADAAGINITRYKYVGLRRPRLARHRARHLHHLAPEREHPRVDSVRRPVHPLPVHPHGHELRHQGALQDVPVRGHDCGARAHEPAQQAREPTAGKPRPAILPRGTLTERAPHTGARFRLAI